ncbi:MAG: K(+)-transporting ATPase subunit F [Acidobacteria bacterium]|nr:MAG: K(+)-transporting ATPase subunit F [Acidobacteriota bacterium]
MLPQPHFSLRQGFSTYTAASALERGEAVSASDGILLVICALLLGYLLYALLKAEEF